MKLREFKSPQKLTFLIPLLLFILTAQALWAHSVIPSLYEGDQQTAISDLIKKIQKKSNINKKGPSNDFDLAELNKIAYTRKVNYLNGERYSVPGSKYEFVYYPGVSGEVVAAKSEAEKKNANSHL